MQTTKGKSQIQWTAQYVALDTNATDEETLALFEALRTESNFTNHANKKVAGSSAIPHDDTGSDGYSVGVLQQQVGPNGDGKGYAWGTVQDAMNPEHAMRSFLAHAKKTRHERGAEVIAQDTQNSRCNGVSMPKWCGGAYGGNYKQYEAESIQLINRLRAESAIKN